MLEIRNGSRKLHLSYHGEFHYNSVRFSDNCIGPPKSIVLTETTAPTTSLPCPLPASNSNHKSTVRLRSAKDVVFQSCPWATNESINTAIHLTNGDAVSAIEILIEGKEKKSLEGTQVIMSTDTVSSASVEEDEEEGGELDETALDESHHRVPSLKTKGPTRGGPCPCNSGLVYKKCCKRKKKARRKMTGEMGGSNTTSTQDDNGLLDSFQRVIVL